MSKQIVSIPLENIEWISILPGYGRSIDQVKEDADYIINGGFYDMRTGKAVGHLKVSGAVLAKETWSTWGFRWDEGADIRMDAVPTSGGRNYISGSELLTPDKGKDSKLSYPAELGGKRGRTALALTADGRLVLYCSGDGTNDAKTPEQLRNELVAAGAVSAIMLDGGGSSQCDFRGMKIKSSRKVHNYIAVWLKKNKEDRHDEEAVEPVSKKVVLDPGHGVETTGKCAPDYSYYEYEFNQDMANRLKAELERHGVKVVLTRSDEHDVGLYARVKTANNAAPDLFVSLHSNASGETWTDPSGYGIYTSAAGETAGRNKAANAILARAKAAGIELWGRGLFHDISLYVLKNTTAPAVLIEHGFHTNMNEVALLKTAVYRDLLAKVDAQGILDYLGIEWVDKPADTGINMDTKYEPWYFEAQQWAKENGISDGTRPEETCTRAEVWQMLQNLMNKE